MSSESENEHTLNCPICLGFGYVSIRNGHYTYDNTEDICKSCSGSGMFSNWIHIDQFS